MKKIWLLFSLLSNTIFFGQNSTDIFSTEWNINSVDSIAGFPVIKLDSPQVVNSYEYEKAVWFDGIDDGLLIQSNPLEGAANFTIEVIFKPDSSWPLNGEQRFIHIQDPTNEDRRILIELRLTDDNQWYLDTYIKSELSSKALKLETALHPVGKWYHASLVYDNGSMKHFVNGVEEISGEVDFLPITNGQTSIGTRMDQRSWFKGSIAKLKVTHTALTPDQFINNVSSTQIFIEPTGTFDDSDLIQSTLDGLEDGDTLRLIGDFVIGKTIYLPSNFTWILDGTLTLGDNSITDDIGYVDPSRNIDARRNTGISEKPGGATNIDMSGGTYYGNSVNNSNKSVRFINFVYVTNSKFHDMVITDASDDCFTLGPGCQYNECRNLVGSHAGVSLNMSGNGLTDKGDYNKWYDCIAEDCWSDGWTPKCRNSEFYRCIARRNLGPGFGMYVRIDGSGNPDLGEAIEGNKFYECESYDNDRSGFSFDISSTSGEGGTVRNNYVQAITYNNRMQGVSFRNKQPNSVIENNEVNIVAWGNKGQRNNGELNTYGGGLGIEAGYPISGITGSVICYDNMGWDVNTYSATECNITAYHPSGENAPIRKIGSTSNSVEIVEFDCSDQLTEWCQEKYCELLSSTIPADPSNLSASTISFSQIDLNWTDNSNNEVGFKIERKTTGSFTEIATLGNTITSYENTGLEPSTTYTYRILAYNAAGNSGYSNEISSTTDSNSLRGIDEIIYDDFEGDSYGNWKDGGDDCKVDSTEHAHQGFYSVNLEGGTSTSVVTTKDLELSYYDDVIVEFWYKAVSMEAGEDYWLQISTNGGSSYATVQTWIAGVDFENDTFYSDSVTITGYTLTNQTRIRFRLDASDDDDDIYLDEIRVSAVSEGLSTIDLANSDKPNSYVLAQNYPNPFNPTTIIHFSIPIGSLVSLKVYDLLGREVTELVNEKKQEGDYEFEFNGGNLSSGIYYYRLHAGDFVETKKFVLIK